MNSLSEKQRLFGIVPVRCGRKRGTAFLIRGGRLLTAVHVVVEYFTDKKPVLVSDAYGVERRFRAEYVDKQGMKDVAVLFPVSDFELYALYAEDKFLPLLSIPFAPSKKMNLTVVGYPGELGNGACLIEMKVRAYSPVVGQKYDVVTIRVGHFELHSYSGFSGSPVVNDKGYVVGIVSTETYGKLTYCSIESVATKLKLDGLAEVEEQWEIYEDSNLSLLHCEEQVDKAVERASGRYHEELHTPNLQIDENITSFTDFNKRQRLLKRLKFLADKMEEDMQEAVDAGMLLHPLPEGLTIAYTEDSYDNFYEHIGKLLQCLRTKNVYHSNLKRLEETSRKLLDKLAVMQKQFMCLHGVAGTGKTHISCHLARELVRGRKNNVYLLFGSEFDAKIDAWDKMLSLLHLSEEDVVQMNERAKILDHYAVIIIDALNEGAGDLYWRQQLNMMIARLKPLTHLKLIVTIRDPFMVEITKGIDPRVIENIGLQGFTSASTTKAIDKYFEKYEIDERYKAMYRRQFRLPLFLITFCESYWLLSEKERNNISRRLLYERYLTSRNTAVSDIADEDVKRNVTLLSMRRLAWHSVEHCLSGLIPRADARRLTDKICPMRTWKNSLLYALLYENLLMETLSDGGNIDFVMFEFENIADIMKAESLLLSKLTERQIVGLLNRTDESLSKGGMAKAKFNNMVRALIAIWDRPTDVTMIEEFTSGRYSYQLVKAKDEYRDERNYEQISEWLKRHKELYEPRELLHMMDDEHTQLFDTLHPYLLSMSMSERDENWTILVNTFLEGQGAWNYVERLSRKKEYNHRLLLLVTWMLTTSDPDARMFLIRLLYRLLKDNPNNVLPLLTKFERCNDHYLQQGLYCAIYGMTLRSRTGKLLADIAEWIWHRYYEADDNVPVDIVLRQWTLKILERASEIEPSANYYHRIRLPFTSQSPWVRMLKKPIPEEYFGKGKGASQIYYSLDKSSDFHRYTIGSNSFNESHEFFVKSGDDFTPISLLDIPKMMAPIIRNDYKYSAILDHYDADRYSKERHHNKIERIGKKYQWLALDATYARLTDNCWVKDFRSDHWGINVSENDLTRKAWPWMTRRYERFDPSMPSNREIEIYAKELKLLPEKDEKDWHDEMGIEAWMDSEKTHPLIQMQWLDNQGDQWVRIYGFQSGNHTVDKEKRSGLLYYNCSFVRKKDSKAMTTWAKNQDFSGRWMAERSDCIDFLWNEMPWSDSYKRLGRDAWEGGDDRHNYPCEIKVAYDEQLQEENYGFLGDEDHYSSSVSMPCGEMMRTMQLYTAERGIIRRIKDDMIVAINLSIINEGIGLLIRKDILCDYMKQMRYHLYCFFHGNKQVTAGSVATINSKNLSACMMMDENGVWKEIQKIRMIKAKS